MRNISARVNVGVCDVNMCVLCSTFPLTLCFRQDMLKRRLRGDFPQLVFHTPFQRNMSEMVFVETLSTTDKLLDRIPQSSGTSATESTEVSQESDTEQMASTTSGWKTTEQLPSSSNATFSDWYDVCPFTNWQWMGH